RRIHIQSVERTKLPEPVFPADPVSKLISLHATHHVPDFPVVDQDGKYIGMVTGSDVRAALIDREAIPLLLVAELLRTDLPTIEPNETLDAVMDKFAESDTATLVLRATHDREKPSALITRSNVMKRYQAELEMS
ncbi:MAG: CBS domain-containing protein, partial [Planctomycetota bacterium]